MNFSNVYEDPFRADSYSKLEFPNTYYLAYRDIPEILQKHARGRKAIDFGCGAGRSTRFIKRSGFDAAGIDISPEMINKARKIDPSGEYYQISDGDYSQFEINGFDLVTSIFTFDNIPGRENRIKILNGLGNLINNGGMILLLDSTPESYCNEWASFSTIDFPENKKAKSGDKVRVIMKDVEDKRPVEDVIWFHNDYLELFRKSGLELEETYRPLGRSNEPYNWIKETEISPWVIYILKR